jgi:hypothetical protein
MKKETIVGMNNEEANKRILGLLKIVVTAHPNKNFQEVLEMLDMDNGIYTDRSEITLFMAQGAIKKMYNGV